MSLAPANVLIADDGAEQQLLVDFDAMEVIGAAPGKPDTLIVSVLVAMPNGPSEVVLATVDANDRLLMDRQVLNRLAAMVSEVEAVKATQEALGVTDEVIAATTTEVAQAAADIEASAEQEDAVAGTQQEAEAETGEPANAAVAQPVAEAAVAQPAAETAVEASTVPATELGAEHPEGHPARDYDAIESQLFARSPVQIYSTEDGVTAHTFEAVQWAPVSSRAEIAGRDGWTCAVNLTVQGLACGEHQLTILGANDTYYLYLPSAALNDIAELVASATAGGASGEDSYDHDAVEAYLFGQTPVYIHDADAPGLAPHSFVELRADPMRRVPLADANSWIVTANLSVAATACGTHDLTVVQSGADWYLYASHESLDAIEATLGVAAGAGESLEQGSSEAGL